MTNVNCKIVTSASDSKTHFNFVYKYANFPMQMHYMHYMPIYDANMIQIFHFSFFMQIIHASSTTAMFKNTMFTDTEEDYQ